MQPVSSCPICLHQSFAPFASINDSGAEIRYVLCKHCGMVLQSPRMDEDALMQFYAGAYRVHLQASEGPTKKDLLMQRARAGQTLAFIKRDIGAVVRHLDIGSSSGALLQEFKDHYGCRSVGIEPGEAYRAYSLEFLDCIYPNRTALEAAGEERFDLITMMHVLEHIPNPIDELRRIRERLLTSNGYLLLEVPNLYEHASFELAHLYAFSASTLREVLMQAGFKPTLLRTHGSFRSPILKLYITALAHPMEKARPKRSFYFPGSLGVSFRRRLGSFKRNFFSTHWPDWTWQSPS
jgi:SAM-dependent methyltransferase